MNSTTHLRAPVACTEVERREFARLVLEGFPAARDLERRVRNAKWLAFHYTDGDTLAAIAALKAPGERYRDDVFDKAVAPAGAADFELELGWVFVVPRHRRQGIGKGLCQRLLAHVPATPIFATTRHDNDSMMRILVALGFARVGRPFPRRDEQLVLFVRPAA